MTSDGQGEASHDPISIYRSAVIPFSRPVPLSCFATTPWYSLFAIILPITVTSRDAPLIHDISVANALSYSGSAIKG